MTRKCLVLMFAGLMVISFAVISFAQQEQSSQQPAAAAAEAPAPAKPVQTEWIYGEVNTVDIAAKTLVLTYLDYDTDIEKQATVYTDSKTIFENVKSLAEVKPQDMVSIDFVAGADSRNLAVTVSVEKPEVLDDLNIEAQIPSEVPAMKPAVETPAAQASGNTTSPDPSAMPAAEQ
jgi:hypothetical protein